MEKILKEKKKRIEEKKKLIEDIQETLKKMERLRVAMDENMKCVHVNKRRKKNP